jgi:SpoVK/Ycf46/Vps4 family AAA+-type ATPase
LSTNLRSNLDEAFARRLDAIVEFPMPEEPERLVLWEKCLGSSLPRSADLDLSTFASSFELSGGNIRSIALTAAYFAAETSQPVDTGLLMRAVEREYRKLGRLVLVSEFGEWSTALNR